MGCGTSSATASVVMPYNLLLSREQTHIRARNKSNASSISSCLDIDKSRIVVPLHENQIIVLMTSWERVRGDLVKTGTMVFTRMFEEAPDVKLMFEKFTGLTDSSMMWESDVVRIHGLAVMTGIDEIMCSLDDHDVTIELLLDQGNSHAHFGDHMTEGIFWAIEKPFLSTVQTMLGTKYKGEVRKLYETIIRFIINVFLMGFREARYRMRVNKASERDYYFTDDASLVSLR